METIERDATGRQIQVLQTDSQPVAGDSLHPDDRHQEAEAGPDGRRLGDAAADLKTRRDDRDEPADRRDPGDGEHADLRRQRLRQRHQPTPSTRRFSTTPTKPLVNHAIGEQFPPGSTYKLVTGLGALADGKITPTTLIRTKPYVQIGGRQVLGLEPPRASAPLNITDGFGDSSDTFFYQVAQRLGIKRLGLLGPPVRLRSADRDRPARRGVRDRARRSSGSRTPSAGRSSPASSCRRASARATTRSTPLQILNAYAALANGGTLYQPQVVRQIIGPDGSVVRPFKPIVHPQDRRQPANVFTIMRLRGPAGRHDPPHLQPRRPADRRRRQDRDRRVRRPRHAGPPPVPRVVRRLRPGSRRRVQAGLAAAPSSPSPRTPTRSATSRTEMVKYFLQLHFHVHKDLRLSTCSTRATSTGATDGRP